MMHHGTNKPLKNMASEAMRPPYDMLTTHIASCKLTVRLGYVYRKRHEKCSKILKHVLKPHDNRSQKQ